MKLIATLSLNGLIEYLKHLDKLPSYKIPKNLVIEKEGKHYQIYSKELKR